MWRQIHRDVNRGTNRSIFVDLEKSFWNIAAQYEQTTRLTRLRIHDILLWLHKLADRDEAVEAGRRIRKNPAASWARMVS
jgi:hypothetical protein